MNFPHITNYAANRKQGIGLDNWVHCIFVEGRVLLTSPADPDETVLIKELLNRLKNLGYDQWYRTQTLETFEEYHKQWLKSK